MKILQADDLPPTTPRIALPPAVTEHPAWRAIWRRLLAPPVAPDARETPVPAEAERRSEVAS